MSKGKSLSAPHVSVEKEESNALGFERLVFFSDAVMAIAITLMALEIRIPDLEPEASATQLSMALRSLVPHIAVYLLSFVVIGTYWLLHHRLFRLIRRYDVTLIWINLIFLMFVAFVPAATNGLGTYSSSSVVTALYAVSLALVGLSEFVLWRYAVHKGFVVYGSSAPRLTLYITLRVLTPPAIFLLSLLVVWFDPHLAQLSWALMIPVFLALRMVFPREHAARVLFESGITQ